MVDTLPAGVTFVSASAGCAEAPVGTVTCTIGTLAAGAQVNLSIEVSVNASTKGTITNSAQVSSTTTDPDSSNNTATQDTQVVFVNDLEIVSMEILNPPSQIIAGQNVTVLSPAVDNLVAQLTKLPHHTEGTPDRGGDQFAAVGARY